MKEANPRNSVADALADCVAEATNRYLDLVCAQETPRARLVLRAIHELQDAVGEAPAHLGTQRILVRAGTATARLVQACADRRTAEAARRLLVLLDELDDERACGWAVALGDSPSDGLVGAVASVA